MNAQTHKPGATLKLNVARVHIHENHGCSPAGAETTKTVTVLSSDERVTVVRINYSNKRYRRMNDTRAVCRIVDSRHVLDECRAFTAKALSFQVGCNGWSWDAGRAA
jgi:hypothetical protein